MARRTTVTQAVNQERAPTHLQMVGASRTGTDVHNGRPLSSTSQNMLGAHRPDEPVAKSDAMAKNDTMTMHEPFTWYTRSTS